jgi:hypothetical protein
MNGEKSRGAIFNKLVARLREHKDEVREAKRYAIYTTLLSRIVNSNHDSNCAKYHTTSGAYEPRLISVVKRRGRI